MTSYEQAGYLVVRELISPALVDHLASYAQVLGGADRYSGGGQVPGSLQLYGDPGFDTVLLDVGQALGEATSLSLWRPRPACRGRSSSRMRRVPRSGSISNLATQSCTAAPS